MDVRGGSLVVLVASMVSQCKFATEKRGRLMEGPLSKEVTLKAAVPISLEYVVCSLFRRY